MFKNIAQLVANLNGKAHQYFLEADTAIADVKEFAYMILKFAGQIEDQQKAMQAEAEAQKAAEAPAEAPPVEEQPKAE